MNFSLNQRGTLTWALIDTTVFGLLWLLARVLTAFAVVAALAGALNSALQRLATKGDSHGLAVVMVGMLGSLGVSIVWPSALCWWWQCAGRRPANWPAASTEAEQN